MVSRPDPFREFAQASYLSRRLIMRDQRSAFEKTYPRFLYRYRPFDALDPESLALRRGELLHGNCWLSSPTAFNDPFDCRAKLLPGDSQKIRKSMEQAARRLERSGAIVRKHDRSVTKAVLSMMQHQELQRIHDTAVSKLGVACFTSDPRSILMWSHYADSHRGIVIQYEIARVPKLLEANPVDYEKPYDTFHYPDDADRISEAPLRKANAWKYENEWRLVEPGKANSLLALSGNSISGIICGLNFRDRDKAALGQIMSERDALGLFPARRYQSHASDKAFRIRIKQI